MAAKRAGMTVAGVMTTSDEEDLREADYLVRDFRTVMTSGV
jgi:beta-phosphoglucomutase-like phosphatase (HAD superfamily)